jgi:hypothetical protein
MGIVGGWEKQRKGNLHTLSINSTSYFCTEMCVFVNVNYSLLSWFPETGSSYAAQAGLQLPVLLLLPPTCWDCKCTPPHLAIVYYYNCLLWQQCPSLNSPYKYESYSHSHKYSVYIIWWCRINMLGNATFFFCFTGVWIQGLVLSR